MTAAPAVILLTIISPEADLCDVTDVTMLSPGARTLVTLCSRQTPGSVFITHHNVYLSEFLSHVTEWPRLLAGTEAEVTGVRGRGVSHKTSLS